ncbi:hypothetical protein Fot_13081 [Forsythia ovata]|uniref:Uncharacterized protein n=1 Tax=Forsythia ovata TaxID=205694 RepID=A0ABD1W4L6_9LAMI
MGFPETSNGDDNHVEDREDLIGEYQIQFIHRSSHSSSEGLSGQSSRWSSGGATTTQSTSLVEVRNDPSQRRQSPHHVSASSICLQSPNIQIERSQSDDEQ